MEKAPSSNLQIIDLARSLSILAVLASHFGYFVPEPGPGRMEVVWSVLRGQGRAAVTIFFMVSGFLITRILDRAPNGFSRASLKWFYARRAGRILPLFLLQVFTGLALIGVFGVVLGDHSLNFFLCFELPRNPWDLRFWGSLLTLLPFSWAVNFLKAQWGALGLHWSIYWSLAIEEQFYLFYPLFLRRAGDEEQVTRLLVLLVLAALGLSCAGFWLTPLGSLPVFTWSDVWCYGAIALGAFLYLADKRGMFRGLRSRWGNWAAVGVGLAAMLAGSTPLLNGRWAIILATPLLDAGMFLALWGGLELPFFESRWLKPLALPGKYCYGLYLLHMVVIYFTWPWMADFTARTNVSLSFGVFAIAATAVAALSYHLFEMPANRGIRRRFGAMDESSPGPGAS